MEATVDGNDLPGGVGQPVGDEEEVVALYRHHEPLGFCKFLLVPVKSEKMRRFQLQGTRHMQNIKSAVPCLMTFRNSENLTAFPNSK